ncbi:MAG: hypothetical protein BroJett015_31860 [Chloroflexota bacterium]|nr:hypothetical protein [Ardenticatenaceae bacterium]GIK57523.1 MAG: hypothetical protein BroJett015_31860 [Chloroflexota bacterium]
MFSDPLEAWLWQTPLLLSQEPLAYPHTAVLDDVQQLAAFGGAADPRLVQFWRDTAASAAHAGVTTPSTSPFRYERRTIAIAALALIAIRHDDAAAVDVLRQLTYHTLSEVRELAVHYLGRVFTEAGRPFPDAILNDMTLIARQDDAFAPRFQARRILQVAGEAVPLDNPDGVYDLKVIPLRNRRVYRTIAIRSEQTLRDLQRFIQHAFEWDNDHLFSFYMNGHKYDGRYRFSCAHEQDRPPWAFEAIIGQLGLVVGHHFLYHYDYAADHLFDIEVIAIRPQVQAGNYPRQIDNHGKAPAQYAA